MKLHLDQFTIRNSRRPRTSAGQSGMNYLLNIVRNEMHNRWRQQTINDEQHKYILWVDFLDATIDAINNLGFANSTIQQLSLLDSLPGLHRLTELPAASFTDVILVLQPAWFNFTELTDALIRLLKSNGRLLFCTFGPDTLVQLRNAWRAVDDNIHIHPFLDMHIIGDQLLSTGFINPILDVDRLIIQYPTIDMLHTDLRLAGFTNIAAARRPTLIGKNRFANYQHAINNIQNAGHLDITFELIYAIATAPNIKKIASIKIT